MFGLLLVLTSSSGFIAVLYRRGSKFSQLSSLHASPLYAVEKKQGMLQSSGS